MYGLGNWWRGVSFLEPPLARKSSLLERAAHLFTFIKSLLSKTKESLHASNPL